MKALVMNAMLKGESLVLNKRESVCVCVCGFLLDHPRNLTVCCTPGDCITSGTYSYNMCLTNNPNSASFKPLFKQDRTTVSAKKKDKGASVVGNSVSAVGLSEDPLAWRDQMPRSSIRIKDAQKPSLTVAYKHSGARPRGSVTMFY